MKGLYQFIKTMNKKEHNRCPHCGHIIDKREIAIFKGMLESLAMVYDWCRQKRRHEFSRKEIEQFLISGSQKARWGDWVLFGGLIYKIEKGRWGLNLERTEDFLFGSRIIPIRGWKDPITGEFTPTEHSTRAGIPGIQKFLDESGIYQAKYTSGPISLFDRQRAG